MVKTTTFKRLEQRNTKQEKEPRTFTQAKEIPLNGEERYRGVFNAALDGIAICDAKGNFFDTNPAFSEMIGYSHEELVSMTVEELIHPEYSHQMLGVFIPEMMKHGKIKMDGLIIRKDSELVPIELYGATFSYEGRPAILVIIRDYRERRKNELRMAHINNVLYTIRNINHLILTENNRDRLIEEACKIFLSPKSYHDAWIVLLDRQGSFMSAAHAGMGEAFAILTTMAKQGKFSYCCNNALSRDGVMIMKEMIEKCVNCPLTCSNFGRATLVVRLEHNNIVYGLLLVSVSARLAEESEEQVLLANVAGDLAFGLHSIELEIKRKEAKQDLLESEERYRVLSENVADGVVLIQNEKLKFVNNAFALMFGYKRTTDLFGQGLGILGSTQLQEHFSMGSEAETPSKSDKSEFETKCMTRDGREIWVEARYNIIPWEGRPAILATLRDITESKIRQMAIEQESVRLLRENIELRSTMKDRYRFGEIVGRSPAMQKIYDLIIKASASEANVIIYGESGTGKELIARTIHERSNRKDQVFVPVNCGAIPDALFESEFFGYRKGAFTGAYSDKPGFFDLAHGGTLFLDEVGELAPEHQVKLLRVIDGGGYTPVGDNKVKKIDVRIIAATNRDTSDMITKGLMREDFFYRIHIIPITVPPLRYRREDVALLIDHFMNIHGSGRKLSSIPGKVFETLYNHEWPGNVRELQNVIQRYVTLGHLDFTHTRATQTVGAESQPVDFDDDFEIENSGLRIAMEIFEKKYISKVIEETNGKKGRASVKLRIPRRTLYSKMKKHGLL